MDAAQEYWRNWLGYWNYVSERAMERWNTTAERIRREDYKIESLLSDTVGFWSETTMASLELWRGQARTPQSVIFCLDVEDEFAGPKYVPLFLPRLPSRPPSFVWLRCIDQPEPSPEHRVDWDNLFVKVADDKMGLEIKLLGLRPPLVPATYRALVHLDEVPVAEVFVVVRESAKPLGGAPAKRSAAKTNKKRKGHNASKR